jgi:MFS family permease
LVTAFRSAPSTRLLAGIGVAFGAAILALALAPSAALALVLLVPMGAASISFISTNNATLQLRADPAMRGRVMSLNAIAFLGSTPIGAPLLGYLSDVTNPRVSLLVGGVATLVASVPLFALAARQRREGDDVPDLVGTTAEAAEAAEAEEGADVVPLPVAIEPILTAQPAGS